MLAMVQGRKTNWEIGEILVIFREDRRFHLGNVNEKAWCRKPFTAVVSGLRGRFHSL